MSSPETGLIPDSEETVACAAIRVKDGTVWSLPRPAYHVHVLRAYVDVFGRHAICEQGFLTSAGRFVDRKEAARLAGRSGYLLSEDLWSEPEFPRSRIATAAIRVNGEIWTLPRPARHHHLVETWSRSHRTNGKPTRIPRHDQGFMTTNGRFVDRREEALIAIYSGEIGELRWPPNLYSEDLW